MGRTKGAKNYKPTAKDREVVENLSTIGISHRLIAKALGIAKLTLEKHYKEELSRAKTRKLAKLTEVAFDIAIGDKEEGRAPDKVMVMFLLKTLGGLRETNRQVTRTFDAAGAPTKTEVSVQSSAPPEEEPEVNFENLSEEEQETFGGLLEKLDQGMELPPEEEAIFNKLLGKVEEVSTV